MIEGIDVDAVIGLFRPLPKIVEVSKYVETPVYESRTYEVGIPIAVEKNKIVLEHQTNVVEVNRQIPIYIEKPV
jgi:hypothetical protein